MKRIVGTIHNKRLHPDNRRTYICDLECECKTLWMGLAFGGWSAILCRCGAEIYRSQAALRSAENDAA